MVFTLLSRMAPTLYKFLATGAVKTKLTVLLGMSSFGAYKVKEWADARAVLGVEGMTKLQLTALFKEIDRDGSGSVSADELQTALKGKGLDISAAQVGGLMSSADANNDGKLSMAEFMQAVGRSR